MPRTCGGGKEHPAGEELHRFLVGSVTPEERRRVAVHLLRGCELCALILRGLLRPPPPPAGAYEEILTKLARQLRPVPADWDGAEPETLY
jgi:hypothetical protein